MKLTDEEARAAEQLTEAIQNSIAELPDDADFPLRMFMVGVADAMPAVAPRSRRKLFQLDREVKVAELRRRLRSARESLAG